MGGVRSPEVLRTATRRRDELAPHHSITSSARASSDGGTVADAVRAVYWVKLPDEVPPTAVEIVEDRLPLGLEAQS